MNFKRHRRLRKNSLMRDLVRETTLSVNDFIQPLFVKENLEQKEEVASMPGVFQFALTDLLEEVESCVQLGMKAFILFGIPAEKDEVGSQASSPDGIVQKALRLIKQHYPDLILIADTCLCEFTSHGHCGILDGETVVNDLSLDRLVQVAISQAEAGADIIMLDNMTPEMMKEAVRIIDGRAETECSGNVTLENVARLTDIGVDYISSGALTHSAPILDVSLKNLHAV